MIPVIAKLLLSAGPTLIREAGSLFGGTTEKVAGQVADFVDGLDGNADKSKALEDKLAGLAPDAQVALINLQAKLNEIEAGRQQAAQQAETDQYHDAQETIRTELINSTTFGKEARPRMAMMSLRAFLAYVLTAEAASRIASAWGLTIAGADPVLAGTILGPAVYYMTMRTVDAFSPHKAKPEGELVSSVAGLISRMK